MKTIEYTAQNQNGLNVHLTIPEDLAGKVITSYCIREIHMIGYAPSDEDHGVLFTILTPSYALGIYAYPDGTSYTKML